MLKLHTEYPESWKSLLEDCKSAKSFIYFEQFIWQDFGQGKIGQAFLDVFKEKARQGVKVKLIIDAVGSIGLWLNVLRQQEIEDAGIELKFFNVVPKWKATFPFNLFHRDHRKVLVVDDKVAHIGGVIISERARRWEDLMFRTTDSIHVREIKGAFLRMWDEIHDAKYFEKEYDHASDVLLKSDPENTELYIEILQRIERAKSKITIMTPYFSPDKKMFRTLRNACQRGITIEILIPEKGDSILTTMAALSYVRQLRGCGMNMYYYLTCMNHGKMVIIDDWVTLGSMNFDRLSFFYNREMNIVLTENIAMFSNLISSMKENSVKVEKGYLKKRGFKAIIASWVGVLFRPIA